jgi:hypothetical protein
MSYEEGYRMDLFNESVLSRLVSANKLCYSVVYQRVVGFRDILIFRSLASEV